MKIMCGHPMCGHPVCGHPMCGHPVCGHPVWTSYVFPETDRPRQIHADIGRYTQIEKQKDRQT